MAFGALDTRGIYRYGEDDEEPDFSTLLNKLGSSVSDATRFYSGPGSTRNATVLDHRNGDVWQDSDGHRRIYLHDGTGWNDLAPSTTVGTALLTAAIPLPAGVQTYIMRANTSVPMQAGTRLRIELQGAALKLNTGSGGYAEMLLRYTVGNPSAPNPTTSSPWAPYGGRTRINNLGSSAGESRNMEAILDIASTGYVAVSLYAVCYGVAGQFTNDPTRLHLSRA